jgi:hypothetical protein
MDPLYLTMGALAVLAIQHMLVSRAHDALKHDYLNFVNVVAAALQDAGVVKITKDDDGKGLTMTRTRAE